MATDKNISALIESQVPEYLREEGPKLVSFLKAYYEWMETTNQVTDASKNLLVNQDIDTTNLSKFYEFFRREVLVDFPNDILADKRLVTKRIKDLYRSKGSKLSYKLLFRILYDQDLDFVNPSDFILRTSDGRWNKDAFIRLGAPQSGDLDSLLGEIVTGQTSGATGRVTELFTTVELGIEVKQLRIADIVGVFTDKETVSSSSGISGTIINTTGALSDVTFNNVTTDFGGSGHQLGDTVSITSPFGFGATGVVAATTDSAVTFDLIDGGSGYRVNDTVVTVSGGTGVGGSVTVDSIKDLETISGFSDPIRVLANTSIGFGPNFGSASNTDTFLASANIVSANVSTALSAALGRVNITVGTINAISVTTGNYVQNLPSVSAIDLDVAKLNLSDGSGGIKGKNARIRSRFIPGAISDIDITDGGSSYSSLFEVTLSNTSRLGTTNARGTPVITGVIQDPGRYTDSKGFLSWNMRLQDNYYYQEYSYVLNTRKGLQVYRDIVNEVLHPAGSKMFGEIDLQGDIDLSSNLAAESIVFTDLIFDDDDDGDELTIPPATQFGIIELSRFVSAVSIDPTSLVNGANTEIGMGIQLPDIPDSEGGVIGETRVGIPSVGHDINPLSFVATNIDEPVYEVSFNNTIASIEPQTVFPTDARLFLPGDGTVFVSNSNVIDTYLGDPITNFLNAPAATFGTPFQLLGVGTTFQTTVTGGSIIEIQDLDPGTTGNTTYIVNTVFSNTTLSMNTKFGGGGGVALANGVYRYVYNGNI